MVKPYRILLADDQPVIRECVRMILAERSDLQVIGEVGDGLELLRLLDEGPVRPDMVILDISMPVVQGIEAARRIRERFPSVKILILTVHAEKPYLLQALAEGVAGFLLKQDAFAELLPAVRSVRQGKRYISQQVSGL